MVCSNIPVTDPAHLSLEVEHQRGHGALHDAISHGHLDICWSRTLSPHHRAGDPDILVVMDAGYDVVRLAWLLDDLPVTDTHPLRRHRPRIQDRIIFDQLIPVLVLGVSYAKIADSTCSASTLYTRRDEWIAAGIFERLEQICLESYDRIIGLDLTNLSVDVCIVKAPCGGEAAGKSPVDRGKLGTKRSLMVDGNGIPIGGVIAGANRNDSLLLRPTLEKLGRFGVYLPEQIKVHLDAGYDWCV